MIDYISGKIVELSPTYAVVDNNGIGYYFEISLQTYDALSAKQDAKLYVQKQINQRDGLESDYGFASTEERDLFRNITSVSGMGASTARIVLSSLSPIELKNAILSEDVNRLKSIKGIGQKTAQRMVLELQDKITKSDEGDISFVIKSSNDNNIEEAVAALVNLGFTKANINKAIQRILKNKSDASIEYLIKEALRLL